MELTRERDLLRSQPIAPVSEPSRMAPGVSRVKAVAPSGQDVSVGDEGESDPMRRAVLAGDVEALRNLIASGADVLQLTGRWPEPAASRRRFLQRDGRGK